jgi:hypothetical protein
MRRSTRVRRGVAGAALGLALAVVLAACGGESAPQLELGAAEPDLQEKIEEEWFPDLDVGAVRCPNTVEKGEGFRSQCTVMVEGKRVTFRVRQTNERGGIQPERYEAILSKTKAEQFVREKYDDVAEVNCGDDEYFVERPGARFRCQVTATNGREAEVIIRVQNPFGDIKWLGNT